MSRSEAADSWRMKGITSHSTRAKLTSNYCRGTIVSDKARQQLREPSARELAQQGMVGAMTSKSGSGKSASVIISL